MTLREHALFRSQPQAWHEIMPHVRMKSFGKEEAILHHGDPASALWLIVKGWVKLARQTPDGKETITGLCSQGDIFGEAALFPNANYPYHAESISADTEMAIIPAEMIRKVIQKNAALSASIMSLLNERVSQTQLKLDHMSTMSTAQRLGCFLLRLCDKGSGDSQTFQIPIEKHLLASYLGMKPETFSRSQQQLKEISVTVKGTEVNVGSVAKLRHFVCNSCSDSGSGMCETEAI